MHIVSNIMKQLDLLQKVFLFVKLIQIILIRISDLLKDFTDFMKGIKLTGIKKKKIKKDSSKSMNDF